MVDSNGDGRADLLIVDTTGDGRPDRPCVCFGVDTTGDGRTDALLADTTGDGQADSLVVDTTGDGLPDTAMAGVMVDISGDGKPDMVLLDDQEIDDPTVSIYGAEPSPQRSLRYPPPPPPRSDALAGGSSSAAVSGLSPAVAAAATGAGLAGPSGLSAALAPEPLKQKAPRAPTSGCGKHGWTQEEDEHIISMVSTLGTKWSKVAAALPGRTDDAVRNRYLRLKRKAPGGEADGATLDMTVTNATKKGDMWTTEEDATICDAVERLGQKWNPIAALLPGRSPNAVRNRYLRVLRPAQLAQLAVPPEGEGPPPPQPPSSPQLSAAQLAPPPPPPLPAAEGAPLCASAAPSRLAPLADAHAVALSPSSIATDPRNAALYLVASSHPTSPGGLASPQTAAEAAAAAVAVAAAAVPLRQ